MSPMKLLCSPRSRVDPSCEANAVTFDLKTVAIFATLKSTMRRYTIQYLYSLIIGVVAAGRRCAHLTGARTTAATSGTTL